MKKEYLRNLIYALFFLFIFVTACNGQVKTQPQGIVSESKTIPIKQAKIIKTANVNPADNIHCGLQDKAGNLWFGTTGEGVYYYDGKSFTNFTKKNGLSDNTVWSIIEDKTGNIWFGTRDGICKYDGKSFTSIPIVVTNGSYFKPNNSPDNNPPEKHEVWSMLQDKSGKLWFGTSDAVYCYNGTFFTRFLDNDSIINSNGLHLKMVQCILEDKNANIWFGSGLGEREGLCRFDGKFITSFKPNGDVWIRSMLEDKNGNLWFGTRQHGICRYDGKDFTNFTEKIEGLHNSSVTAIIQDKAGNIWFSPEEVKENGQEEEDGGVWRYDGKSFKSFNGKDGLGNNSVWSIVEDRTGNIWVGTRNIGLYRYNGKDFTNFTE